MHQIIEIYQNFFQNELLDNQAFIGLFFISCLDGFLYLARWFFMKDVANREMQIRGFMVFTFLGIICIIYPFLNHSSNTYITDGVVYAVSIAIMGRVFESWDAMGGILPDALRKLVSVEDDKEKKE
jgi:hypothetical protein